MCGFMAQLVEHRTGIAEVTGSNPVEALIFSGFFFPIAEIGKLTAMIILHFHVQPHYKYELFHIYFAIPKYAISQSIVVSAKFPSLLRQGFRKERGHSENASNVFRPHIVG